MTVPRACPSWVSWPALVLALAVSAPVSASGVAASPQAHAAARTPESATLALDTLAWVGTGAVTALDLVRRIEWMPWPDKTGAAQMDSAKVRALQSLVGEQLLAQQAGREGLGDSGRVARMRASLRKALVRDALYHDVVAATPAPSAAKVDSIVRRHPLPATPDARRALRRTVADSLRKLSERDRAADFMSRVLGGQRAVLDSATFMLLADSLRALMTAYPPAGRNDHPVLPEYVDALLARLGPSLERPLVRLPGGPLRLGEALEELRFYAFSLHSLEPDRFAAELSARFRMIVEGELMAREGLRRHLDQRPDVQRDLEMWTAAWRANLLLGRIAAGPEASEDEAFRQLALTEPERARAICEVSVAEILCGSDAQGAQLRALLNAGASFDSLARLTTERTEWRARGGRSGFFPIARHPGLGYAALLTPADSLCGPLRLPEGHTIFRVLGKRLHPDSLAGRALIERAREQATVRLRADRVARYVASLARGNRVEFNYAALPGIEVLPANMVTKRFIGFGGGMLAAPSLTPLWDWVPIWRAAGAAVP